MDSPPVPPAEIPECSDIRCDPDGMWHAVHASGTRISGATLEALTARACAVRIVETWRRRWS